MSLTYELAAGAGGLLLLGVVTALRAQTRSRAVKRVRRALTDPDPTTRRAAVFVASERRLAPYLGLFSELTRVETDEGVLAALAEVVLRNQWETADSEELVGLRLWAQAHLDARTRILAEAVAPATAPPPEPPARRSDHLTGDRHPAGPNGAVEALVTTRPMFVGETSYDASEPPGEPTNGYRSARPVTVTLPRRGDGDDHGGRPVRRVPTTVHRGSRSVLPTVLVTGAGGPAGVAVIRALVATGHRVVGVDADGMAAGLRLADEAALVARSDDPTFVDALCDVAAATGASVLVPTVTEELLPLAEGSATLTEAGLAHWLPDSGAVETCRDKWRFAELLRAHGFPGPATGLGSAAGIPGAWVVKPRFGRGSRGVHMVDRQDDLRWVLHLVPEPIVQTRLSGREFTIDVLVDRQGDLAGAVPRWRLETRAGISTRGRTFEDKDLVDLAGELLAAAGLRGPANLQGFMAADGTPSFIEVNPRFSGGLPLSIAAGADLVGEFVRGVLGEPVRAERLTYQPGVTMIRHFEELFE